MVQAIKLLVPSALNSEIDFGIEIKDLVSTGFTYNGKKSYLKDDGVGTVNIVSVTTDQVITDIGIVNYSTGLVTMPSFVPTDYLGTGIKLYATPVSSDISSAKNVVLNIVSSDIVSTITRTRP